MKRTDNGNETVIRGKNISESDGCEGDESEVERRSCNQKCRRKSGRNHLTERPFLLHEEEDKSAEENPENSEDQQNPDGEREKIILGIFRLSTVTLWLIRTLLLSQFSHLNEREIVSIEESTLLVLRALSPSLQDPWRLLWFP